MEWKAKRSHLRIQRFDCPIGYGHTRAADGRRLLKPTLVRALRDTDDVLSASVTRSYRVTFDRNRYSVPSRLVGQSVIVRGADDTVSIFLGPKQVARHARSWGVGEDVKHDSHDEGVLAQKPRAAAGRLPPGLDGLGETGTRYFKIFAAGSRSIQREVERLVLLVELFGATATGAAMSELVGKATPPRPRPTPPRPRVIRPRR